MCSFLNSCVRKVDDYTAGDFFLHPPTQFHCTFSIYFSFFDCSNPFCFLLIECHCTFSISLKYYNIMFIFTVFRLGSDTLFSCFFAVFRLFSHKGSVTGCDSSLGSFCYSRMIFHFEVHASSERLLLLRLCNNGCAEALIVTLKFSFESPLLRLMRLNL